MKAKLSLLGSGLFFDQTLFYFETIKLYNMSRLSTYSNKEKALTNEYAETATENFMGGTSYDVANPIDRLRIIAASSIFGEPQYYRDGIGSKKGISYAISDEFSEDVLNLFDTTEDATTIFTRAIDDALEYDFYETLSLAVTLRKEYNMRLNPAVIFVRASIHPERSAFNENHPGFMRALGKDILGRPDDITNQLDYYMYIKGSKKKLPSIMKRTWADALQNYSRYQLSKYKGKKLIDLVRLSHANNEDINELMTTGTLVMPDEDKTWENLRSEGKTWKEILDTIKIPHMALLRNLRNIFTEINDSAYLERVTSDLISGVPYGKQFPFRYWSAYKRLSKADGVAFLPNLLDALEECMDIAVSNMPKLSGRVACLSDNSGSAWGTCPSEYGSVTVAEIANLSSLITAKNADEGWVGVFGDRLHMEPTSKRNGLMTQLKETTRIGKDQGMGTENGIWLFWQDAIENKTHWDTVFIYSDMQAGHGGLYGINQRDYAEFTCGYNNIDVLALVRKYRKTVNPKVNVFTVQVAGYDNSVLPENIYRGAILEGWTGKESIFAKEIIDTWDNIER